MRVLDGKIKMEEETEMRKNNIPNKYVDVELNYMKEIRETYFKIKDEDVSDEEII
jgi:hypothetical protein